MLAPPAPSHLTPRLHCAAPRGWINDPCGLVWWEGQYHLYYQHNPCADMWGPMYWGHAVSDDLLRWRHHPAVLRPDPDGTMAFTGSTVVDGDRLVTLYTAAKPDPTVFQTVQRQRCATSGDGFAFEDEGIVLDNPGLPDMRDPAVVRHPESGRWLMVLAAGRELMLWSSDNLRDWREESRFGRGLGLATGVWECPVLMPLPGPAPARVDGAGGESLWLLVIHAGIGLPPDRSGAQYIVVTCDGTRFTPMMEDFLPVDSGHDFYAAQPWANDPAAARRSPHWIAWAAHWATILGSPSDGSRGVLTIPRQVSVHREGAGWRLAQEPLAALAAATEPLGSQPIGGGAVDIEVETADGTRVVLDYGPAGVITVGIDGDRLTVDRSQCDMGQWSYVTAAISQSTAVLPSPQGRLRVLVDGRLLECFADRGRVTMTDLIFPGAPLARVRVERGEIVRAGVAR